MPTSAKRPDQRSNRYPRYIQVSPHVCDTSVALGAPQGTTPTLRAVEQVRTDHGYWELSIDLCVMRCLTVLFEQNYITVTHWLLRGPAAPHAAISRTRHRRC
jgi:hypothetical protein